MQLMNVADVERLERSGFAAHRAALEEEARTVAGAIAMRLHDLEEAGAYGSRAG